MNDRPVDRCVCHDVPFAELIRLHRQTGAGLEELQRRTHAGTSCGLCRAYAKAAIATGLANFPVMSEEALERLAAEAMKKGNP